MAEKDPFPMNSEQAAKLAASVSSSYKPDSDWTQMSTDNNNNKNTTTISSTTGEHIMIDQKSSLTGSKKKSKKRFTTSDDESTSSASDDDDDDFLNRPMGSPRPNFIKTQATRLFKRLYGDSIPLSELLRVFVLSLTLFFMIGGYWLLRSLKDPVLTALCGVSVIPKAKMLSVLVVLAVVTIYNKLLDSSIPKHNLFFLFGMFYFGLFAGIALLLTDEDMGLPNEQPRADRWLGWVSYCGIESFGSVMVSLFWSFSNSNVSLESAKASYGMLVATAQVGSILGPSLVNTYAETLGVPTLYFYGAMSMLCLQGTMYIYISIYGPGKTEENTSDDPSKKKKKAGILEGLYLFWDHNYIKGIFAISCLFMVEVTIVDFTMKVLAKDHFDQLHPCLPHESCWDPLTDRPIGLSAEATASFTTFMGLFGQATNTLSFLMSLLGTSAVIRTLGLRLTLLLFPSICLASIVFVRYSPTLYSVFAVMIILKASSYALNNPTKEILYQPTSSAVKYKAKSWIDIFGARGSKALGSVVTNAFSDSATTLVANGSLVGMAVATFLIWNARYMGGQFDEYMESGYIVGGDDEDGVEGGKNGHMALVQNEERDTSCALDDDDDVEEGENDDDDDEEEEEDDDDEEVGELELEGNNKDTDESARVCQV